MKIPYRPEIDGLRAIAVLPVILFHAGFSTFSGGFVGVDVFFVISGYLISSIIVKDIEASNFSFWGFYERRARRILPALFLVMLCCIPFAWMWMMPTELRAFSTSLISVCLFLSNVFFWQQNGYFDTVAAEKPLLHTWSLAVEEQFYIIFPIALIFLWKQGRKALIWSIALVAIVSLGISEYASVYFPIFNFYWLPTRAWELMLGALCSFTSIKPHKHRDNILSATGLIAILLAVFVYDESIPFPSFYALLPVLGACAIIICGNNVSVVQWILSRKPIVSIGLISYSAYLWHQPLFAFARIRFVEPPSKELMLWLCCITIGFAYSSWRWIEVPCRSNNQHWLGTKSSIVSASCIVITMLATGLYGHVSEGLPERFSTETSALIHGAEDIGNFRNECLNGPSLEDKFIWDSCHLGVHESKIDFIVFGDSFAGAIADGLDSAAVAAGKSGLIFGLHGCLPISAVGGTWLPTIPICKRFQQSMLDIVAKIKPKKIILHGKWSELDWDFLIKRYDTKALDGVSAFKQPLIAMLKSFRTQNVSVYIICCTPQAIDNLSIPESLAKKSLFASDIDIRKTREAHFNSNRTAYDLFTSPEVQALATMVDLTDSFCKTQFCELTAEGRPLFLDRAHLSKFGSIRLSPLLISIF